MEDYGVVGRLTIGKSGAKHTQRFGAAIYRNYRLCLSDASWICEHQRIAAHVIKWYINDAKKKPRYCYFRTVIENYIGEIITCDYFDSLNMFALDECMYALQKYEPETFDKLYIHIDEFI